MQGSKYEVAQSKQQDDNASNQNPNHMKTKAKDEDMTQMKNKIMNILFYLLGGC